MVTLSALSFDRAFDPTIISLYQFPDRLPVNYDMCYLLLHKNVGTTWYLVPR